MASRKGYAIRLSALQIQSFVTLQDKLGDMGQDPILDSIFEAVRTAWNDEVLPAEMGQPKASKGKKKQAAEVPTEQEIKQFELKDPEVLKQEAKELVEVVTENNKKK